MFSVVIPLYNKENYIVETLKTVLSQTFSDFEILVVNDGSKDNSLKAAASVNDPRIRILSKDNGGVSSARNYGIDNARFDYIAFLDADDYWLPGFLETILQLIHLYPKAEVYGTNMDVVKNGVTKPLSKITKQGYIDDYFDTLLSTPILHASAVVVKKNAFEKAGKFSTLMSRGEDLDMWVRLARTCIVAYHPGILAGYVFGAQNSSASFVPHPTKSFAYYADFKNATSGSEKKYLKKIVSYRLAKYALSFRVNYVFLLLRKQLLNFFR